eukprot:gene5309-6614_t
MNDIDNNVSMNNGNLDGGRGRSPSPLGRNGNGMGGGRSSRSRSPPRGSPGRNDRPHSRDRSLSPRGGGGGYDEPRNKLANTAPPCKVLGVFGLSPRTDERDLKQEFGRFGRIDHVDLIMDRKTGRSKCFGFVYFENKEDAVKAKEDCQGLEIDGRRIRTDFSATKKPHDPTPGKYYGIQRDRRSPPRYSPYGGGGRDHRDGGYMGGGGSSRYRDDSRDRDRYRDDRDRYDGGRDRYRDDRDRYDGGRDRYRDDRYRDDRHRDDGGRYRDDDRRYSFKKMSGYSAKDFDALHQQLIDLKEYKYESSEREKKLNHEIKSLKDQIESLEIELKKKSTSIFASIKSKVKSDDQEENESLRRTIEQNKVIHQEQTDALQHNIKSLFDDNRQLENQILDLKKDIQQHIIKNEEQQNTIRKLQVDVAELHCSKEEMENKYQQQLQDIDSSISTSSESSPKSTSVVELPSLGQIVTVLDQFNLSVDDTSNSIDIIKNSLKEKFTELYSEVSNQSPQTTPPSPISHKKEIIFHPLGEPEYNPEEEKEKQKLRDTIKGLMEQIRENETKTSKFLTDSKEFQSNIETLNNQIKEWQEKHKNAEINRVRVEEKLQGEIKKLKEDITHINSEKDHILKEKNNDHSTMQQSTDKLNETISNLESQLKLEKENFERLIDEKQQELKEQKLNYERNLADSNDKSNIFKMSRDEYLEKYNTLIKDLELKDQTMELKSKELQAYKEKLSKLEDQYLETRTQLSKTESDLTENKNLQLATDAKSKKLEEKLQWERGCSDSLNEKFNKLNTEKAELDRQHKDLEKSISELEKELEQLKSINQTLESNCTTIQEKLNEKSQEFDQQSHQLAQLQEEMKLAQEKLVVFDENSAKIEQLLQQTEQLEQSSQKLQSQLDLLLPENEKLKLDYEESCQKITKLEVTVADMETEKKISDKKNLKTIKDLKMELSKERDSVNSLSQSANNIPTTPISLSVSSGSVSLPTTPTMTPIQSGRHHHHQRTQSVDHYTLNPPRTPTKLQPSMSSPNIYNQHDIDIMGRKLGELGTENYKLEEKNRVLEEKVKVLLDELDKKTKVVRFYISKTQLGRATSEDEKTRRLKGGATGSFWRNNDPKIVAEMVEKMDTLLQETVLKNIQLTNDMEILGNETVRLNSEMKNLKNFLQENNIHFDVDFKSSTTSLQISDSINNSEEDTS